HRGIFAVGLNTNNINKVHLSQEVAPTLPSVGAVSSACPTVGVTPVFRCDAYAQESSTKIGLGVHKRRKHAMDANSYIDTVRNKKQMGLRSTPTSVEQQGSTASTSSADQTTSDQASPTAGTSAGSLATVSHGDQPEIRPIPIMAFRGSYRSELQELDDLIWATLNKLPPSDGIYSSVDIILRLNPLTPSGPQNLTTFVYGGFVDIWIREMDSSAFSPFLLTVGGRKPTGA
ncbi:hypothetical protein AVEN_135926-1, partial [Araneus ventricosus]